MKKTAAYREDHRQTLESVSKGEKSIRRGTSLTLLVPALLLALSLCVGCATTKSDTSEGAQVPDFEMTLLNGESASFDDFRGKKVLLNFWATWCGPCVGEMPALQRLAEEYPEELVILAVDCGEDQATVQAFIDDNGYTFPVVLDSDDTIGSLFGGVTSIPMTVIIDEKGNILSSSAGAADADTMYETYMSALGL